MFVCNMSRNINFFVLIKLSGPIGWMVTELVLLAPAPPPPPTPLRCSLVNGKATYQQVGI